LALDSFRRVASFRKQAEAKAAAMGFTPSRDGRVPEGNSTFFSNLSQLDELLADQERRAAEPPRGPIPGRDADPKARVAALILNLDQIAEHQMSNPGGPSPGSSPLVRDLVAMGDPAVEPLLKALVDDTRLTRSIAYGRGIGDYRRVSPTLDAIMPALDGLMKASVPGVTAQMRYQPDAASRRAMADAYRKYWEANRDVPLAERDYRLLADDAASARWQTAASGLVSPAPDPSGQPRFVRPGQPPLPFLGEPLRGKREPSVTDLMIRRAEELAERESSHEDLLAACAITTTLSRWDPPASLPVVNKMMDRAIEQFAILSKSSSTQRPLVQIIVRFTLIRTQAGDREALDDYAAWIRTTTPESVGEDARLEAFEPMWIERDHPSIAEASRALFADPKSPWLPLSKGTRQVVSIGRDSLETSPLIRVPAFREAVLAWLSDKTPAGTVIRNKAQPEQLSYKVPGGGSGGFGSQNMADLEKMPFDEERPVRACDWLALRLASLDGSPRFEMSWPEPKRDEAIAALAAFLRRYGDRYEAATSDVRNPFEPNVRLAFPRLDRPATPADVEAGRAIFSLEGVGGEVRVVPLPELPLFAAWMTLEDSPLVSRQYSPNGEVKIIHSFDRSGHVWQAEEVRVGDRWQRFFGFVSSGRVDKAPAEEVEFPLTRFSPDSPGSRVDVQLSFVDPTQFVPFTFPVGKPSLVAVGLRNRTGLDQAVPTEFVRPGPDGKPALREGVTLKLTRTDVQPEELLARSKKPQPAEELQPTRDARFTPGDATRPLGPAQSFEAFRLDLRDWFDLSRPGQYRLEVVLNPDSGIAPASAGGLYFVLGE
jgi:hypothetical protein